MPRLVNADFRTHQVVDAINYLILDKGVDALSMREIGRVARLSPSTLYAHYGSRQHMLRVAADETGRGRLSLIKMRLAAEGARALLPADDEDVLTARACHAQRRTDSSRGRPHGSSQRRLRTPPDPRCKG
jgi:AcrR family transcriptional regulator